MRHTNELSLLLSVSVMTGLYNFESCIDIGLDYYQHSTGMYPIKLGRRGVEVLENSKNTCEIIDICNNVCEIFDVNHNLKKSPKEFEESFAQMYKMAVVTKHLADFQVKSEPHLFMQK